MSSTRKNHPAIELFTRLFQKAASPDNVYPPETCVNRWTFVTECKRAGIAVPDNPVEIWNWEEAIGLNRHARRLVAAYHRARGTKPGPGAQFWKIRK